MPICRIGGVPYEKCETQGRGSDDTTTHRTTGAARGALPPRAGCDGEDVIASLLEGSIITVVDRCPLSRGEKRSRQRQRIWAKM